MYLMKLTSKMLQNWPYFWNKKTQLVFFVFHFEQLNPKWLEIKNEKNSLGFLVPKLWQILKYFAETISSSINLLFLKCVILILFLKHTCSSRANLFYMFWCICFCYIVCKIFQIKYNERDLKKTDDDMFWYLLSILFWWFIYI